MERYGLVPQKDEWGCGAACVASLLGISYAKAKGQLERIKEKPLDERPYGLELHQIALCLAENGLRYIADWEEPKNYMTGTIVCIGGSSPYDGDHYLLMTPHGWMDPYSNMSSPGDDCRESTYRDAFPNGTEFLVALIPKK
jgi:hypothetical protein